ncbi:MAG TPA: YjbQ family protein [Candidatus Fraserbacteria bacterium]|nr:YjbQ family protein [Candidatus Fraserbacteria bacterium]
MKRLSLKTQAKCELLDITDQVTKAIRELGLSEGACLLFVPHTTAAITINENADPAVKDDILTALARLVPPSLAYRHLEGNAHAHIQTSLIGSSVLVPVANGRPALGTWQGILFCEFDGPRSRELWLIDL